MRNNKLYGPDFDFATNFESKLETFNILNIIKSNLTDKGIKMMKALELWISVNSDKYLKITGK